MASSFRISGSPGADNGGRTGVGALATESRKMQLEGCWCSAPPLEGARCTQQNRNQGGKTREGKADPVTKGRQTERLGGKDRQMDTHREKHGERNSQEGGVDRQKCGWAGRNLAALLMGLDPAAAVTVNLLPVRTGGPSYSLLKVLMAIGQMGPDKNAVFMTSGDGNKIRA